jgi:glycosyltransferase involved in cell wall biosynthesis
MVICFLANAKSTHTEKWCKFFIEKGHEVHLLSFFQGSIEGVQMHFIDTGLTSYWVSDMKKLRYLVNCKKIRNIINEINPDIIHAHNVSSYGFVCALAGIHPYILSAWGRDVYDAPQKSFLHRIMIKYCLKQADYLFSTSNAMKKEMLQYTHKEILVTPFGVDTDLFKPVSTVRPGSGIFRIGIIKALRYKYGIDYLLRALRIILDTCPECDIELQIAGNGPQEEEFKRLSKSLDLENNVRWLGRINQSGVIAALQSIDVALITSILDSESFGVSAIEAQACGVPVIVTDVGGLTESTCPGKTSLVVPPKDSQAIANAVIKLMRDEQLRKDMGRAGREFVIENFKLEDNFSQVEKLYLHITENKKFKSN